MNGAWEQITSVIRPPFDCFLKRWNLHRIVVWVALRGSINPAVNVYGFERNPESTEFAVNHKGAHEKWHASYWKFVWWWCRIWYKFEVVLRKTLFRLNRWKCVCTCTVAHRACGKTVQDLILSCKNDVAKTLCDVMLTLNRRSSIRLVEVYTSQL